MTLIIGLGHKARQGKDTFAGGVLDYFAEVQLARGKHGGYYTKVSVQRIGFADALYDMARNEYGMTTKDAPLLQRLGSKMRETDEQYWIKRAFAKIQPTTNIAIITDVRYKNEAEYVHSEGGYLVDITRLNLDGSRYIADDRPANHPSEIDLDGYNFDFYLTNSHGHEALLKEQAITLVEYLRGLHS